MPFYKKENFVAFKSIDAYLKFNQFIKNKSMGESVQVYSWIQGFEADFPLKVSLKMLCSADYNSFFDLVIVYIKVFDH